MPATRIIDLDKVVGPDKQVKLAGDIYKLPADIPAELWLRITRQSGEAESELESTELLYEAVLELFRHRRPKLERLPIGLGQLMSVISHVYGGAPPDEDDDAAVPPRTRGGAGSSTRPKRSRS